MLRPMMAFFLLLGLLYFVEGKSKSKVYEYEAPNGMRPEDLMECFHKTYSMDPTIDSLRFPKKPYLPEDLGELFLYQQINNSDTVTKEKADYFVVNTMPVLSAYVGECLGMDHNERQEKWTQIIKESNFFQERPQDHIFICQSWTCANTVSGEMYDLARKMTYLIHETNIKWLTRTFSKKPEHMIVVPYVIHSNIYPFNHKAWVKREHKISFIGSIKDRLGKWRKVLLRPTVGDLPYLHIVSEGVKNIDRISATFDNYVSDMVNSQFCLILQGDSVSSRRLFDAMKAGCIPVFTGPKYSMPFENLIPYDDFSIRIDENEWVHNPEEKLDIINKIGNKEALQMQNKMQKYVNYIDWRQGNGVLEAILSNMDLKQKNSDQHVQWHVCHNGECDIV